MGEALTGRAYYPLMQALLTENAGYDIISLSIGLAGSKPPKRHFKKKEVVSMCDSSSMYGAVTPLLPDGK